MPGTRTLRIALQDDLEEFDGTVEAFISDFCATAEGRHWELVAVDETGRGPVALFREVGDIGGEPG